MDLPSDLIDLLAAFDAAKAEYLLVGGLAVALHGHPRFTKDADLWIRDTPENVARVVAALRAFGAPAATCDALRSAEALDVVWMGHPPARIDIMKGVPGGDFDRAWASRVVRTSDDVPVILIGREELRQLKLASGRAQDLLDAEKLA